jgi:cobalt-zinc-cadmium efflux system protein
MGHEHIQNINKRFIFGILLNVVFIIIEIFYGIQSNSVALIADATHNAGDVLGLLIAWFGYLLANKKAPKKFTYGFKNATVIAAFINALLLFAAIGGIAWESFQRLAHQQSVASGATIIVVAAIGVFINGLTAYFFLHDNKHADINIKGAFLHMALDACVSFGVVIGGLIILWKSWMWIDPLISFVVIGVVMISSWKLFKESLNLMLMAVPTNLDLDSLSKIFVGIKGIINYHDLHVWPISTTETALSAHLVVMAESFTDAFAKDLEKQIKQKFPISHVTLQLELQDREEACETNCD